MADRPIIFSAPMVRALLEGRKSQTRRVLKPQPGPFDALFSEDGRWWTGDAETGDVHEVLRVPYAPGDRLWVKEDLICATETMGDFATFADVVCYAQDGTTALRDFQMVDWPWQRTKLNNRFCPRWASRLTLIVTDVRVQRLQEISEADAMAEGARPVMTREGVSQTGMPFSEWSWRDGFRDLWNSLHGPEAWASNPWVAAISFDAIKRNIDKIELAENG